MLSRELEVTLNLAFKNAREKRHEFMTVEHLLLALLDDASASSVLKACGADLNALREDLSEFIDSTMPTIPDAQLEQETQPTHGLQRVLQRAVFQVNSANDRTPSKTTKTARTFQTSRPRPTHDAQNHSRAVDPRK